MQRVNQDSLSMLLGMVTALVLLFAKLDTLAVSQRLEFFLRLERFSFSILHTGGHVPSPCLKGLTSISLPVLPLCFRSSIRLSFAWIINVCFF